MAKDSYRFGAVQLLKTLMAVLKGAYWAEQTSTHFDYALAYWGNYSATAAYVFHKLSAGSMGFGTFLHAGTDLYRDQIYLKEKLRAADNIVVVCDFNREYVRSLYPDAYAELAPKIVLHHPGLDLRSFSLSKREKDPNSIISVGGFSRAKGFDILLKALRILRDGGCPATVDLVGDGEEAPRLKDLASTLGISEYVRFRGWLTPAAAQEAISNATLLVHPSNGLGDAVPTVIKEAMTLGVPVGASNVAGIPELLDNGACGTLVKPGDETELAAAIGRVLENAPLRIHHATLARQRAEQLFDAERNGLRLASVLRGRHSAIASPAPDLRSMHPVPSNT
jgi:glycosyltransferase involved in cell wall biosynthesis